MSRVLYSDSILAGPEMEPVDLDQVKRHLKVSGSSEDTLIDGMISAARQRLEQDCGRHLIQTLRERRYHGGMPMRLELPAPPLLSVVSLQYLDSAGALATIPASDYVLDPPAFDARIDAEPAVLAPAVGVSWPSVSTSRNAVRVQFYAGYGRTPGEVPEILRSWVYALVETFYKFRGHAMVGTQAYPSPLGYDDFVFNLKASARCQDQPSTSVAVGVA